MFSGGVGLGLESRHYGTYRGVHGGNVVRQVKKEEKRCGEGKKTKVRPDGQAGG